MAFGSVWKLADGRKQLRKFLFQVAHFWFPTMFRLAKRH